MCKVEGKPEKCRGGRKHTVSLVLYSSCKAQLTQDSCFIFPAIKKYILVHNLGQMISIGSRNHENTLKICYFGLVSEKSEAILCMNIELLLVNISGREMRNL